MLSHCLYSGLFSNSLNDTTLVGETFREKNPKECIYLCITKMGRKRQLSCNFSVVTTKGVRRAASGMPPKKNFSHACWRAKLPRNKGNDLHSKRSTA